MNVTVVKTKTSERRKEGGQRVAADEPIHAGRRTEALTGRKVVRYFWLELGIERQGALLLLKVLIWMIYDFYVGKNLIYCL